MDQWTNADWHRPCESHIFWLYSAPLWLPFCVICNINFYINNNNLFYSQLFSELSLWRRFFCCWHWHRFALLKPISKRNSMVIVCFFRFLVIHTWFLDDSWKERWVQSKHKDDYGELKLSHGKFYGDEVRDQGLKTSQDAKVCWFFPEQFFIRFLFSFMLFLPSFRNRLAIRERVLLFNWLVCFFYSNHIQILAFSETWAEHWLWRWICQSRLFVILN